MIEQLLGQFFEHLRYERNVSEHTLRNYASDLSQFYDYLAPADAQGVTLRPFFGAPEGAGRLEVDGEVELEGLLDRQVGGPGPLQDLVHLPGR